MYKKLALLSIFAFIAIAGVVGAGTLNAQAQVQIYNFEKVAPPVAPVPDGQMGLLMGQTHNYSVVFRGNGEVLVFARFTFTNPNDYYMSLMTMEFPKVTPSELVILQEGQYQDYYNYNNYNNYAPSNGVPEIKPLPAEDTQGSNIIIGSDSPDSGTALPREDREMFMPRYPSPLPPGYTYPAYNPIYGYKRVTYTKTGNTYNLSLPYALAPYQTGNVLIAYSAQGYVKKGIGGLFKYDFETIKVPYRIANLRVSIDVDSDLYIKNKKSNVNYSTGLWSVGAVSSSYGNDFVPSTELGSYVNRIGYDGYIFKDAKNLAANESYSVKGEFASSRLRLYLVDILKALVIVVLIGAAIRYVIKRVVKHSARESTLAGESAKPGKLSVIIDYRNWLMGLACAVLVIVSSVITMAVFATANLSNIGTLAQILFVIVMILVYVIVIFSPAVYIGVKRGWLNAAVVVFSEIVWMIVALVFFVLIYVASH